MNPRIEDKQQTSYKKEKRLECYFLSRKQESARLQGFVHKIWDMGRDNNWDSLNKEYQTFWARLKGLHKAFRSKRFCYYLL